MSKRPRVSDHALVRYLERTQGLDLDAVRREIGERVRRGAEIGATGVLIDGYCYVIEANVVVTVRSTCSVNLRTGRRMKQRDRE